MNYKHTRIFYQTPIGPVTSRFSGAGLMYVEGRWVYWMRYVDWFFTTPFFLLDLALLAGADSWDTFYVMLMNAICTNSLTNILSPQRDDNIFQKRFFVVRCSVVCMRYRVWSNRRSRFGWIVRSYVCSWHDYLRPVPAFREIS